MERIYWDSFNFNEQKMYFTVDDFGLTFVSNPSMGISEIFDFYADDKFEFCYQKDRTANYRQQFEDYLAGELIHFTFPINLQNAGTPIQKRIWQSVCQIDYGRINGLQQLMNKVQIKHVEIVKHALKDCPVLLAVPTHRVITKDYRGGEKMQNQLLELEAFNGIDDTLN